MVLETLFFYGAYKMLCGSDDKPEETSRTSDEQVSHSCSCHCHCSCH